MCELDGCGDSQNKPKVRVSEIDRRAFLLGAASLPLAAILAYPEFAAAQAAGLSPIEVPYEGGIATGVIAKPAKTPAPAVVLIHEWWGLNDNIKAMAAEFANLGYLAFAIDLHGGKVATTPNEAKALTGGGDNAKRLNDLKSVINFLRHHKDSNGKVGTIGWCFGGGWSLDASIAEPVDATVIYYGRVTRQANELQTLQGPVLGHFATEDKFINAAMVGGFESEMAKAGKSSKLEIHWYTANHAFANPTGARYDAEDAAIAWARTTAFFEKELKR